MRTAIYIIPYFIYNFFASATHVTHYENFTTSLSTPTNLSVDTSTSVPTSIITTLPVIVPTTVVAIFSRSVSTTLTKKTKKIRIIANELMVF